MKRRAEYSFVSVVRSAKSAKVNVSRFWIFCHRRFLIRRRLEDSCQSASQGLENALDFENDWLRRSDNRMLPPSGATILSRDNKVSTLVDGGQWSLYGSQADGDLFKKVYGTTRSGLQAIDG
jgi:hypothetical protein